jgi:hypothetical protein
MRAVDFFAGDAPAYALTDLLGAGPIDELAIRLSGRGSVSAMAPVLRALDTRTITLPGLLDFLGTVEIFELEDMRDLIKTTLLAAFPEVPLDDAVINPTRLSEWGQSMLSLMLAAHRGSLQEQEQNTNRARDGCSRPGAWHTEKGTPHARTKAYP